MTSLIKEEVSNATLPDTVTRQSSRFSWGLRPFFSTMVSTPPVNQNVYNKSRNLK